mmetsp:Transcript_29748/g.63717  ORF Transcript_29748/g.63717 Transcript_29748/m.63717 type:complete len:236 (-) Transcript_29748:324-1031(-)|eukprot:CAMPEP_0201129306 /NCGR_PEP_ID=MMETSP0850-20130426/36500_1 /ASSEMBLY_ACC=CAM_ASM_000622 /TAXON_ID=183588 /ORGANISM="Pseudo-nitzschia fraudulenta, Strain WWA7" /LENGTH=235 /DNA_ID=CAMNT_0047398745 /DNA_START=245 /DNA_END=952 /DNA_ORIENTATION=+
MFLNKSILAFFCETVSLLVVLCLLATPSSSAECACKVEERPDLADKAKTARWMVHSLDWGVISTISSRLGGGTDGSQPVPFGNVYSFVDGSCDQATGIPYIYGTYMDQSFADSTTNDMVSLTLSESSLSSVCPNNAIDSCMLGTKYGDPESPMCARLTLTGKLVALEDDSKEHEFAKSAFYQRHPSMQAWPDGHGWVIAKIEIEDLWLIDYFGGATVLDPKDYFAAVSKGDETME